jgi:hypothetical protein
LSGSALEWRSSIDGTIGSGSSIVTSALSAGIHEITLTAEDSDGETYTTPPVMITNERTRFIKMGFQTTGVPDASNAFDGDLDTAATIMTRRIPNSYTFKAYIGGADTFIFKIKLGASTPGSSLPVEGLALDNTWQLVSNIGLDNTNTVEVTVKAPQDFKDSQGYVNLRVRWLGGGGGDSASIFELWRVDPFFAGTKTTGTNAAELSFDGNPATGAIITTPWDGRAPFLHFKTFVGSGAVDTFAFNISHNRIGPVQFLVIEIEDPENLPAENWIHLGDFSLNSARTRKVTISNVQDFLDSDGYLSLRAFWVGYGSANQMEIYEISRIDPILIGQKTTFNGITSPENAVDGDDNSLAIFKYYWGESDDHYDFLHVKTYAGDASVFKLNIIAAPSDFGSASELIVEGEAETDNWSLIDRIILDSYGTRTIELLNARDYVDAEGHLNLRVRWESDSLLHDAYIYEISRETD